MSVGAGTILKGGTRRWVRRVKRVSAPIWRPLQLGAEIVGLPWVRVTLGRDAIGMRLYAFFAAPHLKYRFIPWKCLGVALQEIPASAADYLDGKAKHQVRTYVRRAAAAGYVCRPFDPRDHHDEIVGIFHSSTLRQGAPVTFEDEAFARTAREIPQRFIGVFARDGRLVGLTCAEVSGELAWMRVYICHHDHLRAGVSYALLVAQIEALCQERAKDGTPRWLMYDFWFGKSAGMRYFIRRCGFRPVNVRWRADLAARTG